MNTDRLAVAWIAIGSNLEQPADQIDGAFAAIGSTPGLRLLARSRRYRTSPVGGPPGQDDFCNAAAAVGTTLSPLALLDTLNTIEVKHGRVRTERNGPRTLDLDIIAFDDRLLAGERLTLPHPRASERAFVLVPLADIAPALRLGSAGRVVDCLGCVNTSAVVPWG